MRFAALQAAVICSGLAACTQADGTTAIGMVGSPAWMATASPETKLATYRANCAGYGYVAGTAEMASCMQSEAQDLREGASMTMAAGLAAAGSMQPRQVRTNCNTYGTMTNCTSSY